MDRIHSHGLSYLFLTIYILQIVSLSDGQREPSLDSNSLGISKTGQTPKGEPLASLSPHENNIFLQKLLEEYGTDGSVTVEQLTQLIKNIQINFKSNSESSPPSPSDQGKGDEKLQIENTETTSTPSSDSENLKKDKDLAGAEKCRDANSTDCSSGMCLDVDGIFRYHDVPPEGSANGTKFERMSPTILYQLQDPACKHRITHDHVLVKRRPTVAEVWGYGFLCVTLINLCALMGIFFLPLMRRSFYQKMLMFMVALAVGTLTGSGLMFLIPESFEMTTPESEHKGDYVWRFFTVVMGIYMFFLVERILKMIIKRKQDNLAREEAEAAALEAEKESLGPDEVKQLEDMPIASVPTHSVHCEDTINMSFKPVPSDIQTGNDYQLKPDSSSAKLVDQCGTPENGDAEVQVFLNGKPGNLQDKVANGLPGKHGHSHGDPVTNIRSVAWMVILGDGLHNFIDGLSIGAAFSGSVMTGISVSLAVFCEELPHELGDFAILLNSGMSMKQALGYNFLSACMCYLGLVIGILVGEATEGAVWIFAVAGGMFLYIALVDMLPEVNHAAEAEEAATGATWSVFFIQNAGMLTGIILMLLLALYSGNIDFSSLNY